MAVVALSLSGRRFHLGFAPARWPNTSRACDTGGMWLPIASPSREVCWAISMPGARGPFVHFTRSILSNEHDLRPEGGDGPSATLVRECRHRMGAFDV